MESINVLAVCSYAVQTEYQFPSFEALKEAYVKHLYREALKSGKDPLIKNAEALRKKFRKNRFNALRYYNFHEVMSFLIKNHYLGTQVFSTQGTDPTECIYSKDGVRIYTSGYGYIEVIGLSKEDFNKLYKAYVSHATYLNDLDKDW